MYAVLTERPVTRPYSRAHKLLRALVDEVLDVDAVGWLSVTKAEGDDPPSYEVRRRDREWMTTELAAVNPSGVILVGATVRDCWRGDLAMTLWHGQVGTWLDKWAVMPIHHPAQVFARHPEIKLSMRADLSGFPQAMELYHESRFLGQAGFCGDCGTRLDVGDNRDPDGVGYCARHWVKNGGMWEKQRARWFAPLDQLTLDVEMG